VTILDGYTRWVERLQDRKFSFSSRSRFVLIAEEMVA
jgi:hypothetical protein